MYKRKFLPELLGFKLYQTLGGKYFYAWNAKHAYKKMPASIIFFITPIGKKIRVWKN